MQPLEYFGALRAAVSGDVTGLIAFFEEDAQLLATLEAIGDVALEAAAGAIAQARRSRDPRREIGNAVAQLQQTHVAYTKVRNSSPAPRDREPTAGEYFRSVQREFRMVKNQVLGKWAQDAEEALKVCRVSALIAACYAYLDEPVLVYDWLDTLRADRREFERVHPEANSAFGETNPLRGGDLTLYFQHIPYAPIYREMVEFAEGLTRLVEFEPRQPPR